MNDEYKNNTLPKWVMEEKGANSINIACSMPNAVVSRENVSGNNKENAQECIIKPSPSIPQAPHSQESCVSDLLELPQFLSPKRPSVVPGICFR